MILLKIVPTLVPLLTHINPEIKKAALMAIGNLVLWSDSDTQKVLDQGVLPMMGPLLQSDDEEIKKVRSFLV